VSNAQRRVVVVGCGTVCHSVGRHAVIDGGFITSITAGAPITV